jgi:hypothetical protein
MPKGRGGNGTCDREAGRDFERDPKGNNTNSINPSQFGGGICKMPHVGGGTRIRGQINVAIIAEE